MGRCRIGCLPRVACNSSSTLLSSNLRPPGWFQQPMSPSVSQVYSRLSVGGPVSTCNTCNLHRFVLQTKKDEKSSKLLDFTSLNYIQCWSTNVQQIASSFLCTFILICGNLCAAFDSNACTIDACRLLFGAVATEIMYFEAQCICL